MTPTRGPGSRSGGVVRRTKVGKLHLPMKAPRCFDSQEQWRAYRAEAMYSAESKFTYCSDCLAAYRDAMVLAGRCAFPGTVFGVDGEGQREKEAR